MAWCPMCESEYIEGVTYCKKCNVSLVEKTEEKPKEEYSYIFDSGEFLIHANNEVEADIIKGLLNSEGIHVIKKHREAGDYLTVHMGSSNFGVDLFVLSDQLDKAKEILNSKPFENEIETDEDSEQWTKEKEKMIRRRRIILLIFLLILHAPLFIHYLYRVLSELIEMW